MVSNDINLMDLNIYSQWHVKESLTLDQDDFENPRRLAKIKKRKLEGGGKVSVQVSGVGWGDGYAQN